MVVDVADACSAEGRFPAGRSAEAPAARRWNAATTATLVLFTGTSTAGHQGRDIQRRDSTALVNIICCHFRTAFDKWAGWDAKYIVGGAFQALLLRRGEDRRQQVRERTNEKSYTVALPAVVAFVVVPLRSSGFGSFGEATKPRLCRSFERDGEVRNPSGKIGVRLLLARRNENFELGVRMLRI